MRDERGAISLVELLIGSIITIALLMATFFIYDIAVNQQDRAEARARTQLDANIAFQRISREIRQAVKCAPPLCQPSATPSGKTFLMGGCTSLCPTPAPGVPAACTGTYQYCLELYVLSKPVNGQPGCSTDDCGAIVKRVRYQCTPHADCTRSESGSCAQSVGCPTMGPAVPILCPQPPPPAKPTCALNNNVVMFTMGANGSFNANATYISLKLALTIKNSLKRVPNPTNPIVMTDGITVRNAGL